MRRTLDSLVRGTFDVLIVGGGITGAGVALDAALRGLRVALIEKADFASGTSSASSKLVHGGLRYLEYGDFSLVYEALHERRLLLDNAPHLVQPLRFVIPFYCDSRVPGWQWRLGLTIYDLLAGRGHIGRSRPMSAVELRRSFASLRAAGLRGAASYLDAQMDDARVCLAVLRSAAQQGACVANYVEAVAFVERAGRLVAAQAVDRLSGGKFVIHARQIVNAAGPWVDAVARLAGLSGQARLRPTKGVHLVAPGRGLSAALLLLHPHDGRVFFVIPWLGKTLIGTTDTLTEESPDELTVTSADVDYLLNGHNHYLHPPLSMREVLSTFVGLRPLRRAEGRQPAAMSREFRLDESANGLLSAIGGKYTTYRRMAEVITDAIVRRLGVRRRCRTHSHRLDGAPDEPWPEFECRAVRELCRDNRLSEATARHLLRRYGRHAARVVSYGAERPEWLQPIVSGEPDIRAELVYQRHEEMAIQPADFLLRRTRLGLFHPQLLESPPAECSGAAASEGTGR
ncbi:MAG: glycerol-3-phosphate dehydrogenase [Gemmataceae bacterium]|nr:glycerol-3-phosphate dehydrogenase [Gemmataceae bacterium]MDW8264505.1 glycerol-3-phosphate dehydrogenase [Gemmataceae bacterium]